MGGRVPAPVTYWTGIWQPEREALSKEVDLLRRAFGQSSRVVSFSAGQRSGILPRDGVIRLSGRRWILLRTLAATLERSGAISHVIGEMHAWHLLRALGRRPILFTVAIPGPPLDARLHRKVCLFAPETEDLADSLVRSGVPASRIVVVYPGIDTTHFAPGPARTDPFRVVFASSPACVSEFGARGIPLMVEAARRVPEIEVALLWRAWGDRRAAQQALRLLEPPPNLVVEYGDVPDMSAAYREANATVWLGDRAFGKSCPNSVIEGLACGAPAIVSRECGIAGLIARAGAGVATARDPDSVARAFREIAAAPAAYARRARALAEELFSVETFLNGYRELYAHIAGR
jgi:glycosyltransferase involved in cell wall biosynthesis